MKKLSCEICGSTQLLKQDGVFICQSCGTTYATEEAMKKISEETAETETINIRDENKKKELEQKISYLNTQINSLVIERKACAGYIGYFLLSVGLIMFFLGFALMISDGIIFPVFVAIPELIISAICLKKTPSKEVVQENIKKKQRLLDIRKALQKELDSLK